MAGRSFAVASTIAATLLSGGRDAHAADAQRWAPPGISSPQYESHPAFDPRTGDLYFVRSSPRFSGWRILFSHCGATGWEKPVEAPFAAPGVEADPFFTADGKTLFYISTRLTGSPQSKDLDIWRLDRTADGTWGPPERLPEPVNSGSAEWFPRPSADGWLYFGSSRPGGMGGNDIWRARQDAGGAWKVENLGAAVNTAGDEYEPLPSADGKRLLIAAADAVYDTLQNPDGSWSPRRKLPAAVNAGGSELGALWSPSGRSLLFARDTGVPDSGELFVWHEGGAEDWPPRCPAGAAAATAPGAEGVRAAEDGWSRAFVTGDARFLEELLDPAYISVSSKGVARSKADIVALAVKYAAEHPGTAPTPLPPTSTIAVKGTAAVVTHHNPSETSVDVFYFADGRWRAWYSQHTAVVPAP